MLGRFETVAGAPNGGYKGRFATLVELVSQVADVNIHHVGPGVEGVVPNGGEDLLPTENLSLVAHEVFEECKLAARKIDQLLPAPHPVRAEVHLQVAYLYPRRLRLVGASNERPHPREQLLQVERFGQVVICSAIQGVHLITHLVAGGEH